MLGAAPLGERDKINIGIAFPIATAARAQYLMPFYHLCLEKNGSKFTPLAKTAATFCKMPWMWQGRVEKMPRTLQLWGQEWGGCLNTRQTPDSRSRANKSGKFTGGEAGLPWPRQLHNSINSRLAQGWFFSPSNSPRTCTLLWWIFCTITDYCHGNRCITWQLCYLRDKKQLLKDTGVLQEWGYLFPFIFFSWLHSVLGVLSGFLMDAASIIWTVQNVSVHQLKVIFSHIIFLPLTRNAVCVRRKKEIEFPWFWEKQNGFFLPS